MSEPVAALWWHKRSLEKAAENRGKPFWASREEDENRKADRAVDSYPPRPRLSSAHPLWGHGEAASSERNKVEFGESKLSRGEQVKEPGGRSALSQ